MGRIVVFGSSAKSLLAKGESTKINLWPTIRMLETLVVDLELLQIKASVICRRTSNYLSVFNIDCYMPS